MSRKSTEKERAAKHYAKISGKSKEVLIDEIFKLKGEIEEHQRLFGKTPYIRGARSFFTDLGLERIRALHFLHTEDLKVRIENEAVKAKASIHARRKNRRAKAKQK
jgi:hypothetical protein